MKISAVITRVRDRLNEATANVYTDAELVRYVNEAQQDLFRRQAQADESYHNFQFDILGTSAREQSGDYLYDLPTWVHKITSVRPTSTTNKDVNIPVLTIHSRQGSFWAYNGSQRILIAGSHAGDDITIECSKTPALLNGGIAAGTPTTTEIIGTIANLTYEYDLEDNTFANAMVENTLASARLGEIAAVSASTHDGTSLTLTFDRPFATAPVAADTWEMHLEVQNPNIALVVLLAASKAYMKKSNWEAMKAIRPDLEREEVRFIETITPRQDQIHPYVGMDRDVTFTRDLDRHRSW